MTDLITKLEELLGKASEVPWSAGCLAHDDPGKCECAYIFDGGHAGSIGSVAIGNGLPIGEGGNDCPTKELAKANLRLIVEAVNSLPELIQELRSLQARNDELVEGLRDIADAEVTVFDDDLRDNAFVAMSADEMSEIARNLLKDIR